MLRMPRNDSSKNDPLDLELGAAASEASENESAQTSVPEVAPEAKPEPAGKVKIAFDSDYQLDDRADVVVVSVAGTPCYELKTSGTPLEVPAEDALLLSENSPAVKVVN